MKQKLFFSFLAIALSNYYGTAQKGENAVSHSSILVNAVTDGHLGARVSEAFDALRVNPESVIRYTGIPTFRKEDFDFGHLYVSSVKDQPGRSIVAPYKLNIGDLEFGFVITENESVYSTPMLVKSLKDRSNISFYDLNDGAALSIDKAGNSFNYRNYNVPINEISGRGAGGCGQAVMNCISDTYSNHGWASVWAGIQSIFVPSTGVAVAIACVLRNCQ